MGVLLYYHLFLNYDTKSQGRNNVSSLPEGVNAKM